MSKFKRVRLFYLNPRSGLDSILLIIPILLCLFGLVMVYSTTGVTTPGSGGNPYYFLKRQIVSAMIGFGVMLVLSCINIKIIKKYSPHCLFIAFFLVAFPHLGFFGDSAGGATRWVRIGSLRFQPVEFAKPLIVIFFAGFYSRHKKYISNFIKGVVTPFALLFPIVVLLLTQPDFGNTVVVSAVVLAMGLVVGVRISHLLVCGFGLLLAFIPLVIFSPYRMRRLLAFMSPQADIHGKGYQLMQSLIALGSGETFGLGLGESQQKLSYLPAAHTDFIFAVVGEELGFFGCLCVVIAFFILTSRYCIIASHHAHSAFNTSLTVGLGLLVSVPAFLNMAVVSGLVPTKGMALPFVGYGGSNLVASFVVVGLLQALHRTSAVKKIEKNDITPQAYQGFKPMDKVLNG